MKFNCTLVKNIIITSLHFCSSLNPSETIMEACIPVHWLEQMGLNYLQHLQSSRVALFENFEDIVKKGVEQVITPANYSPVFTKQVTDEHLSKYKDNIEMIKMEILNKASDDACMEHNFVFFLIGLKRYIFQTLHLINGDGFVMHKLYISGYIDASLQMAINFPCILQNADFRRLFDMNSSLRATQNYIRLITKCQVCLFKYCKKEHDSYLKSCDRIIKSNISVAETLAENDNKYKSKIEYMIKCNNALEHMLTGLIPIIQYYDNELESTLKNSVLEVIRECDEILRVMSLEVELIVKRCGKMGEWLNAAYI